MLPSGNNINVPDPFQSSNSGSIHLIQPIYSYRNHEHCLHHPSTNSRMFYCHFHSTFLTVTPDSISNSSVQWTYYNGMRSDFSEQLYPWNMTISKKWKVNNMNQKLYFRHKNPIPGSKTWNMKHCFEYLHLPLKQMLRQWQRFQWSSYICRALKKLNQNFWINLIWNL